MPFGQIYKLGSMSNFFRSRMKVSSSSKREVQLLSVEMGILVLNLRFIVAWVCWRVWPRLKYVSAWRMMGVGYEVCWIKRLVNLWLHDLQR